MTFLDQKHLKGRLGPRVCDVTFFAPFPLSLSVDGMCYRIEKKMVQKILKGCCKNDEVDPPQ